MLLANPYSNSIILVIVLLESTDNKAYILRIK